LGTSGIEITQEEDISGRGTSADRGLSCGQTGWITESDVATNAGVAIEGTVWSSTGGIDVDAVKGDQLIVSVDKDRSTSTTISVGEARCTTSTRQSAGDKDLTRCGCGNNADAAASSTDTSVIRGASGDHITINRDVAIDTLDLNISRGQTGVHGVGCLDCGCSSDISGGLTIDINQLTGGG